MTLFEFLILIGLAIVIALLLRLEGVLKKPFAFLERQGLESTIRTFMPKLWVDPEFHDSLAPWLNVALGPYDPILLKDWNWNAVANGLHEGDETIPPVEVIRLVGLSTDFLRDAESSRLLTSLEAKYLLFHIWNLHFSDPSIVVPNDVLSFEDELSNIRKKYLTHS